MIQGYGNLPQNRRVWAIEGGRVEDSFSAQLYSTYFYAVYGRSEG